MLTAQDGEIYQGEDDPRYIQFLEIRRKQQPTEQPRPATASQTSANPSPAGARFDRNAPPFAVVQQGSMFGLPDLVVSGWEGSIGHIVYGSVTITIYDRTALTRLVLLCTL